jgi:hypothetical protein
MAIATGGIGFEGAEAPSVDSMRGAPDIRLHRQ